MIKWKIFENKGLEVFFIIDGKGDGRFEASNNKIEELNARETAMIKALFDAGRHGLSQNDLAKVNINKNSISQNTQYCVDGKTLANCQTSYINKFKNISEKGDIKFSSKNRDDERYRLDKQIWVNYCTFNHVDIAENHMICSDLLIPDVINLHSSDVKSINDVRYDLDQKPPGIYLFEGDPGSGKTTMIEYLKYTLDCCRLCAIDISKIDITTGAFIDDDELSAIVQAANTVKLKPYIVLDIDYQKLDTALIEFIMKKGVIQFIKNIQEKGNLGCIIAGRDFSSVGEQLKDQIQSKKIQKLKTEPFSGEKIKKILNAKRVYTAYKDIDVRGNIPFRDADSIPGTDGYGKLFRVKSSSLFAEKTNDEVELALKAWMNSSADVLFTNCNHNQVHRIRDYISGNNGHFISIVSDTDIFQDYLITPEKKTLLSKMAGRMYLMKPSVISQVLQSGCYNNEVTSMYDLLRKNEDSMLFRNEESSKYLFCVVLPVLAYLKVDQKIEIDQGKLMLNICACTDRNMANSILHDQINADNIDKIIEVICSLDFRDADKIDDDLLKFCTMHHLLKKDGGQYCFYDETTALYYRNKMYAIMLADPAMQKKTEKKLNTIHREGIFFKIDQFGTRAARLPLCERKEWLEKYSTLIYHLLDYIDRGMIVDSASRRTAILLTCDLINTMDDISIYQDEIVENLAGRVLRLYEKLVREHKDVISEELLLGIEFVLYCFQRSVYILYKDGNKKRYFSRMKGFAASYKNTTIQEDNHEDNYEDILAKVLKFIKEKIADLQQNISEMPDTHQEAEDQAVLKFIQLRCDAAVSAGDDIRIKTICSKKTLQPDKLREVEKLYVERIKKIKHIIDKRKGEDETGTSLQGMDGVWNDYNSLASAYFGLADFIQSRKYDLQDGYWGENIRNLSREETIHDLLEKSIEYHLRAAGESRNVKAHVSCDRAIGAYLKLYKKPSAVPQEDREKIGKIVKQFFDTISPSDIGDFASFIKNHLQIMNYISKDLRKDLNVNNIMEMLKIYNNNHPDDQLEYTNGRFKKIIVWNRLT